MARTTGRTVSTQPPPSRYRVVEQGRRLVVIDTLTGEPATRAAPETAKTALPTAPERTDFDGRSTLVTHPLYDDKAPRTLTLDPGATRLIENGRTALIAVAVFYVALVIAFPWLLLAPVALLNPRVRRVPRAFVTQWLDRYDR